MFQRTYHQFQIAEAKGHVPNGTAFKLTLAACLEGAAAAFHKEYFGPAVWAKEADSISRHEKDGAEIVGTLQESMLSDLSQTRSVLKGALKESLVTTDFSIVLANLRTRMVREGYIQADSVLASMARARPTSNFRLMNGMTISNFEDLSVQPEGQDVDYATFTETEDNYKVAMYSKAIKFTYQLWKNDDYGIIIAGMRKAGRAAKRTRHLVVGQALLAGLPAQQYGGAPSGPTITALEQVIIAQGSIQVQQPGGAMQAQPRLVTDLLIPIRWQTVANTTLHSQQVWRTGDKNPMANPVLDAAQAHVDVIWSEIAGANWLAYDRNAELVELSVLDDFEGGPLTITKLPDVGEHPEQGAFSDNTIHVKFCDACGSAVTPEGKRNGALVQGA